MKTVVKMGILLGVWIAWAVFSAAVDPIIANQLALGQMNNTVDSSLWIQAYSIAKNYEILWFAGLAVIVFLKEI